MVSHQLAKFGGHRHCGSGHIIILACHVIPRNRKVMQLYGQEPIKMIKTLLISLVAIGTVVVKI